MTLPSYKRALSQLVLLPVLALTLSGCILALQIHSLESAAAWVDHSDRVIAGMNELTRLMIDQETGIRGYLLTGGEEFLEPYQRARGEIDSRFRELQELVNDDPSQVERLRKLSAQNDAWEKFAGWRLAAKRTNEQLIADSRLARPSMDQLRWGAAEFIHTEEAIRAKRFSHARFRSRMTYVVLPLLTALAAALISVCTRRSFCKLATMEAQQNWLNTTLRGIGDAVIACDPGGRVVFMNVVAETLTGWNENEARGHAFFKIFPLLDEDTRAVVESPIDKVLRLGTVVGLPSHTVLVRKDGSEIAVDDSGAPIRDPSGSLIGVVTVFRDVSQRRAMERALQGSEAELRARAAELEAIMQVVPAVTFIAHDPKCEHLTSSLLAYELLRLRLRPGADASATAPAELQNFRAMKNGRELAAEELPLQIAAATGREVRDFELTLAFDDGSSRDIFGNAAPLFDEGGAVRGAVGAFIDITGHMVVEEARRRTEKIAIVGRLAANLSHEINNPLESVTNLLYLLQSAPSLEHVREYTQMAQEELARVNMIASQTLRFHRQSSRPTVVNVPKLLDSALALYGGRFSSANIGIERQYEGSASLYADDGELLQVFVNLIGNAFDATRNVGTRIVVRERRAVDWTSGSKGIRITVADTGHGMDRDTVKRIFEPFFSTKDETGTGLGLWITKEIIEKHHGSVRVYSSQHLQKHGTVFSIFFPFEAAEFNNQRSRVASATR